MGEWDVDGMLRRMPSRLLSEWMAFFELEPFGEERADLRAGIIASVIANVHRDPKRRARAYRPQDFMPKFGRQRKSPDELLKYVEFLNQIFGGEDRRKQR